MESLFLTDLTKSVQHLLRVLQSELWPVVSSFQTEMRKLLGVNLSKNEACHIFPLSADSIFTCSEILKTESEWNEKNFQVLVENHFPLRSPVSAGYFFTLERRWECVSNNSKSRKQFTGEDGCFEKTMGSSLP